MIRVTCGACGASFKAKEEHAGKRARCPSCGQPITVPEADDEPEPERVAPVASVGGRRRGRGGGRRVAGGGGVRRPGGRRGSKDYTAVGLIAMILTITAVGVGWFAMQEGDGPNELTIGLELMNDGKLAEAKANFERVPTDSPSYAAAQEYLAETVDLMASEERRFSQRRAENVYQIVKALEKRTDRDGKGHLEADYTSWARYMLKRADEFLQTWPDHPKAVEVKQIAYRFSDVASLDEPPTYQDVEIELSQRLVLTNPNFMAAMAAVDELAARGAEHAERAATLRARVTAKSLEFWRQVKEKIDSEGLIQARNWQRVANITRRYLDSVEGVPGLTEAVEARQLFDRALAGG